MSQNIKLLLTHGCSFTQVPNADLSWPVPLGKALGVETEYHGRGACGNGIISRSVIYTVTEALKKYKPEELLVGIMWSGYDRHDFFLSNPPEDYEVIEGSPYYKNPQWITSTNNSKYYVTNKHWNDGLTEKYMKTFFDDHGSQLLTLEHILRTQWFLKFNNIKYFMTRYARDVMDMRIISSDPDTTALYELIDFDNFLEVDNMDVWAIETGLPYRIPGDQHPSTEMHQLYVDTVILPHLHKKGYINDNCQWYNQKNI